MSIRHKSFMTAMVLTALIVAAAGRHAGAADMAGSVVPLPSADRAQLDKFLGTEKGPFNPVGEGGGWFDAPGGRIGVHGDDPGWGLLAYFRVAEIGPAADRVRELGGEAGELLDEPGFGRFCHCRDPQGMLERTERRIAQQRVWILTENGKTIFKADVISDTPQVAFIEGVFVRWQERRKGYGLRCMTQLARNLLGQNKSICLVVNEENTRGRAFYDKAGFKFSSHYSTAYFSAL